MPFFPRNTLGPKLLRNEKKFQTIELTFKDMWNIYFFLLSPLSPPPPPILPIAVARFLKEVKKKLVQKNMRRLLPEEEIRTFFRSRLLRDGFFSFLPFLRRRVRKCEIQKRERKEFPLFFVPFLPSFPFFPWTKTICQGSYLHTLAKTSNAVYAMVVRTYYERGRTEERPA